jgi:hypothetical protein
MMIRWICKKSPPIIVNDDPTKLGQALRSRVNIAREQGIDLSLYYMSLDDTVCSVGCLLLRNKYPFAVFGMGTSHDFETAACKSIDEAISVSFGLIAASSKDRQDISIESISTFSDHAKYYALKKNLAPILSFFNPNRHLNSISSSEIKKKKWQVSLDSVDSKISSQLKPFGFSMLTSDLSVPELRGDWRVYRAVLPEAYPIEQSGSSQWKLTPRLLEKARLWDVKVSHFNQLPHPFA